MEVVAFCFGLVVVETIITGSCIWVYCDATRIGVRPLRSRIGKLGNMGPTGWAISCFLLWIVVFPYYCLKREEFKEIFKKPKKAALKKVQTESVKEALDEDPLSFLEDPETQFEERKCQRFVPPVTILVPMLISGIINLLVAFVWISTCFGALWGIPMFIVGIFEIITFSQAKDLKPLKFAARAKILAICDVCLGLFNIVTLITGIIILLNLESFQRTLYLKSRKRK